MWSGVGDRQWELASAGCTVFLWEPVDEIMALKRIGTILPNSKHLCLAWEYRFIFKGGHDCGSEGSIWQSDEIKYIPELFFNSSCVPGVLPCTFHVSSHFLVRKQQLWGLSNLPVTTQLGRAGIQIQVPHSSNVLLRRWAWRSQDPPVGRRLCGERVLTELVTSIIVAWKKRSCNKISGADVHWGFGHLLEEFSCSLSL